jgi:steroid delta-isomerase-like uncharacterized protein
MQKAPYLYRSAFCARYCEALCFKTMSDETNQVRKFYEVIWNARNKSAIPEVLHEKVQFRGSLGQRTVGIAGFAEYLDMVHTALSNYHCHIEELVTEPPRVFAKMIFSGTHEGEFMGHPPTGKLLTWSGAALFTFEQGKIVDLWVLGDLQSLENQLRQHET